MKQNNRFFQNAKWIIGCKVVQAILQLIIGMLTARYLGPSNYGLINYAASVTAFLAPFMQLGLQATLVQEYIVYPEENQEILGTSLVMTLCSGFLSMLGVIGFSLVANWGETTTIIVCALYSISLICQAGELVQYWFQARMLSKYSSLAMLGSYVVVSAYKIYLLASGQSVYWFALTHAVEYGISGIIMFVAYWRIGGQRLQFSRKRAKDLFSRSRYYILASLMITVFSNTDHIMLKLISGNAENGFYTTAITCTCVANFLYYGIVDAARPAILESRHQSTGKFDKYMAGLYSVIIWMSLVQSLVFTVLAEPIVLFLYGREYLAAVPVLQIIVWQIPFSYIGTVRNIWILGVDQHHILWKVNLCGALANVLLNAIMIPVWGACGAAFASVLTQFFTNVVTGFLMPQLRQNNWLMVKSLNPGCILALVMEKYTIKE